MALSALAFVSSVAAAYCLGNGGLLPAFVCSALAVPLLCGFCARGFAGFAARTVILFGSALRLAALAVFVSSVHGGISAAAVILLCAAVSLRLALSDKSALYAPAPAVFAALALLPAAAIVSPWGGSARAALSCPDAAAWLTAAFCPVSAGLALSQNAACTRRDGVKGLAPGAAVFAAALLFPSTRSVFGFICVPVCAAQLALELRAVVLPSFRE